MSHCDRAVAVTEVSVLSFPAPPSVVSPASKKLIFVIDLPACDLIVNVSLAPVISLPPVPAAVRVKTNWVKINRICARKSGLRRTEANRRCRRIFRHIDVIDRGADVRSVIDGHRGMPAEVARRDQHAASAASNKKRRRIVRTCSLKTPLRTLRAQLTVVKIIRTTLLTYNALDGNFTGVEFAEDSQYETDESWWTS